MKTTQTIVFALTLCASLLATDREAQADEQRGSFVVRNPNNVAVHYQVRWGDGEWKSQCLYPGYKSWHAYPLDEHGCVPTPYVRFDWIAGDGKVTNRGYEMDVYATYCPEYGKPYVFRYSRCGCYLDLYKE